MKPREIEMHIEELVLHGFPPAARWQIADALENELQNLLATRGIPPSWLRNPEVIRTKSIPAFCLTNPALAGGEAGRAIYRGGGK